MQRQPWETPWALAVDDPNRALKFLDVFSDWLCGEAFGDQPPIDLDVEYDLERMIQRGTVDPAAMPTQDLVAVLLAASTPAVIVACRDEILARYRRDRNKPDAYTLQAALALSTT